MFRNGYNRIEYATEEELSKVKAELRDVRDDCHFRIRRLENVLDVQDWNGASEKIHHLEQLINYVYEVARKGSNKRRKVTIISGNKTVEVRKQ